VSIKGSSSEHAAPPRIMVEWNSAGTAREVTQERILIPVELSGKIKNVSNKYEIYRAWVFVPGGSKTLSGSSPVPSWGYTLLRNRNPVRNIGGKNTLGFFQEASSCA